ncbi:BON domain-containing protein [Paraburkholderia oxyphila]|uniref:BON domain-containing protein n=1 Tax=Paraburkholderia oxyphila TaxID=614212 RepID=UPI0004855143|nr:BON domain-containing protein [Paraburkholderia oxyphila]
MKRSRLLRYAAIGVFAMAVASAYAQNGEDSGARQVFVASGPAAKEIRAADRKLRKAVLRSLTKAKGLNANRIVVMANGGVIWLEGYVPETDQIALATSVAQGVVGVDTVNNRLIVRAEGL